MLISTSVTPTLSFPSATISKLPEIRCPSTGAISATVGKTPSRGAALLTFEGRLSSPPTMTVTWYSYSTISTSPESLCALAVAVATCSNSPDPAARR